MACVLSQGYVLDCRDSLGGVKELLLAPLKDIESLTETAGVVTDITMVTDKVFYRYELVKNTSVLTETVTSSVENGTVFYSQELQMVLNKLQTNTRNEILLLAKNTLVVIVKDANDKYWMLGKERGVDVTGGTATTGTAQGDRNGYQLTFTGQEKEFANEVDSSIIDGLV